MEDARKAYTEAVEIAAQGLPGKLEKLDLGIWYYYPTWDEVLEQLVYNVPNDRMHVREWFAAKEFKVRVGPTYGMGIVPMLIRAKIENIVRGYKSNALGEISLTAIKEELKSKGYNKVAEIWNEKPAENPTPSSQEEKLDNLAEVMNRACNQERWWINRRLSVSV